MTLDDMTSQLTDLCECGCGKRTNLFRGRPRRFIFGHQNHKSPVEYILDENTGCWVWQRALAANGYASIRENGKARAGHRVIYERHKGPIPVGLSLDHLCRNPRCVNPDHLEPVTHAENCRRGAKTKLDFEKVRVIRASVESDEALATRYGVAPGTVHMIRIGQGWKEAA